MMRYNKLVYIKEKVDNNTYIVIEHDTHKQIDHPVHSDRLKKYYNEKDMFPTRLERGEVLSDSDEKDDEGEESSQKPDEGTSKVTTEKTQDERGTKEKDKTKDDKV